MCHAELFKALCELLGHHQGACRIRTRQEHDEFFSTIAGDSVGGTLDAFDQASADAAETLVADGRLSFLIYNCRPHDSIRFGVSRDFIVGLCRARRLILYVRVEINGGK